MTRALHSLSLRYFLEVANSGSINMASEAVHVAASAISRQLSKFEHELGTTLFERRARGMVLTEAGQAMLNYARRRLLEDEQVLTELKHLATSRGGTVKLACSQGFATEFLPRVIAEFQAQHPRTCAHLLVTSSAEATDLVRRGEVDLAITFSLSPEKGVNIEYAGSAPIYALMHRSHALADRKSLSLAELQQFPLVLSDAGTTIRVLLDMACSLEGVALEPRFASNSSSALYRYARQSNAIMFSGYLTAGDSIAQDGFVAVPIRGNLYRRRVEVQTMSGRTLPAHVRGLVDFIVANIERLREAEAALSCG